MNNGELKIKIIGNENEELVLGESVGDKLEELHDTLVTFADVAKTFVKSYSKKDIDKKKRLKIKKTLYQWLKDVKEDIDNI